jgi:hypothetical protein
MNDFDFLNAPSPTSPSSSNAAPTIAADPFDMGWGQDLAATQVLVPNSSITNETVKSSSETWESLWDTGATPTSTIAISTLEPQENFDGLISIDIEPKDEIKIDLHHFSPVKMELASQANLNPFQISATTETKDDPRIQDPKSENSLDWTQLQAQETNTQPKLNGGNNVSILNSEQIISSSIVNSNPLGLDEDFNPWNEAKEDKQTLQNIQRSEPSISFIANIGEKLTTLDVLQGKLT